MCVWVCVGKLINPKPFVPLIPGACNFLYNAGRVYCAPTSHHGATKSVLSNAESLSISSDKCFDRARANIYKNETRNPFAPAQRMRRVRQTLVSCSSNEPSRRLYAFFRVMVCPHNPILASLIFFPHMNKRLWVRCVSHAQHTQHTRCLFKRLRLNALRCDDIYIHIFRATWKLNVPVFLTAPRRIKSRTCATHVKATRLMASASPCVCGAHTMKSETPRAQSMRKGDDIYNTISTLSSRCRAVLWRFFIYIVFAI